MRKETEFEIVSGCAEGFVSKTMTVSCEMRYSNRSLD
jgi:hypothetical protein